jgi:hypothetical protein
MPRELPRSARSPLVLALAGCLAIVLAFPATAMGPDRGPGGPAAPGDVPAGAKQLPALTAVEPDALTRALAGGRISPARYALERATSIFRLGAVRSRFGDVRKVDARSATLILRDLLLRVRQLEPADRRRATEILARPTDGSGNPFGDDYTVPEESPVCSADACVHYVASTDHKPSLDDTAPADGIPDWVALTSAVLDEVWAFEVDGYGYRAPKSDLSSTNNGGDAKLDVYLADLGPVGLFGYCTTDDPNALDQNYTFFDFSAYCVLDNDYVGYGYADTTEPLKVTAAHEFFHAVQFAYDAADDGFFHEGTATWMEDEVYDAINDNLFYLGTSPLAQPTVPLDRSTGLRVYGTWIFWRFLAEYIGANDGGGSTDPDPTIIRDIWERADGSAVGPDDYSVRATARAIANRSLQGTPWRFRWAFADFAVWNARPGAFYDEGGSYPAAAIALSRTLRGSRRSTLVSARLDHQGNRFVVIRRGSGLSRTATLRVTLDGPPYNNGTEASLVVIKKSGAISLKVFQIATNGDGSATVGFGRTVSRVIVIVTNASTRYRNCFVAQTPWACSGDPIDDNRLFTFRASVR